MRMTADEFDELLGELRLSQRDAAKRLFGVGQRTACDWANPDLLKPDGTSGPPPTAARLLRLVHYLMKEGDFELEEIEGILSGEEERTPG